MRKLVSIAALLVVGGIVGAGAMMMKTHHGGHGASNGHSGHDGHSMTGPVPVEVGQSAFAAIAEIVSMLGENGKTKWSEVNITALRDHLVDMEALTMKTTIAQENVARGMRVKITGAPDVLAAVKRMVPMHAKMLESGHPYASEFQSHVDHAVWTVTTDDNDRVDQLRALGFYGLMATGAHHQPHHFAVATGKPMH